MTAHDTSPGSPGQQPRILSREEAAAYLRVSVRYIDRLVSEGHIPRGKLGSRTIFRREDLDAYVDRIIDRDTSIDA